MHILVLTDNFVPEQNAPALRTHQHCRRWVQDGIDVTVVTTVPNFPVGKPHYGYRNRWRQEETIDGIRVVRVWSYMAPNEGVIRRSLDFLSFAVTSWLAGRRQKPDVIVATSPQLLTGLAGHRLSRTLRVPWVFEVRDLWPDSIVAVDALREGRGIRALRRLEESLYASANRIVTISEALREAIAAKGVDRNKISVVSNGVDPFRVSVREKSPRLLQHFGYEGKFVVGYVGTHGMAQRLETIVKAAKLLETHADIRFLFVGEGARRKALAKLAKRLKLSSIEFHGLVSSGTVVEYIALCDAIVVPLKKSELFEGALPTKIFEAAAMERPIVLSAEGIAADLVRKYGAGTVVDPENAPALADAILKLRNDPALRARYGQGGKALAAAFNRNALADLMLNEIRRVL
jgi:glycosyltransferase involved in cell wall biosynthesis